MRFYGTWNTFCLFSGGDDSILGIRTCSGMRIGGSQMNASLTLFQTGDKLEHEKYKKLK